MDYLPLAFNILLLLFWVRLWAAPDREFYFNPFLSGTVRMTDSVLAFLRPVLNLPEPVAAWLIMVFVVAFKTLFCGRLQVVWTITFGTGFTFAPPIIEHHWGPQLLFSVFHFVAFLLKFWCVYLIVKVITPPMRANRATETLAFFARPFSRLPFIAQAVVLAALHVALAFAVSRTGVMNSVNPLTQETTAIAASPFLSGPLVVQLLKTGWLAALSMADGFSILIRALFVLIIGNFAAAILQAQSVLIICLEGVELLMGRFARNRAVTGMGFDFTPLIFFFVVDMAYRSLCLGLINLIQSPYFNP